MSFDGILRDWWIYFARLRIFLISLSVILIIIWKI